MKKPRYGTHSATLKEAVMRSEGPMIEVGAGMHSTPMLLQISKETGRPLVTVERQREWTIPYVRRAVQLGIAYRTTAFLEIGVSAFQRFGVALVDGAADERAKAVEALLPKCDYIVVHDTEKLEDYPGLKEIMVRARFRYDVIDVEPWTTVVSDLEPWR